MLNFGRKVKKSLPEDRAAVSRNSLTWLMVAQGVIVFPLFFYLTFWLPLLWSLAVYWRVQILRGAWSYPSNRIKIVLGLSAIAALVLSYGGRVGVEPLVAFLVVSYVLKLLEVRREKDVVLVIYVGFITVAAQFIFSQAAWAALYGVFSVVLNLCAWSALYRSRERSALVQFRAAGVLVLQSIPLMLILFLVMPRLGSLWYVPLPKSTGVTGFSDTMSPGDFSQLSQSKDVAFRVGFDEGENPPPRQEWYWRGLVLHEFNGRTWKRSDIAGAPRQKSDQAPDYWNSVIQENADVRRYSVLLEPHQQRWLFTMATPLSLNSNAIKTYFSPQYLSSASRPIASRMQYKVVSSPDVLRAPLALSGLERRRALQLPSSGNPRAMAFASSLRENHPEARPRINAALQFYRRSFSYTLQPPALGADSIDEFLFDTQRGFCEHFASSFTFVMRATGIPARVVIGYQGGELNQSENYVLVRQLDAHAWAEVWLPNEGWLRVDPTGAVAPSRIENGLSEALDQEEQTLVRGGFSSGWMLAMQMRWDAFNYHWQRWVLAYDEDKQRNFFEKFLGGKDAWRVGFFFLFTVGVFLLVIFAWLVLRTRQRKENQAIVLYRRWLKQAKKHGFEPEQGETPRAFAERIAQATKIDYWRDTMSNYYRWVYAGDAGAREEFEKGIKSLRAV